MLARINKSLSVGNYAFELHNYDHNYVLILLLEQVVSAETKTILDLISPPQTW